MLFFYLFVSLNSVFSSEHLHVSNYRNYTGCGVHGKEGFEKFYNHYYDSRLLEEIKKNYLTFNFDGIIKNDNKEELRICFGFSPSLILKNKFVKTNLVEFIRYSPLYFQSVIEEIKAKPIFKKYLYHRKLPLIIGSGLFLPSLFLKNKSKMKISLSLLFAFSGGGAFWMWQQKK